MGYSFVIGDAIDSFDDEGEPEISCEEMTSESCPKFVDSEQSSKRMPSYSAWSDFCEKTGLEPIFMKGYKKNYILKDHPGYYELTKEDLKEFKKAKKLFQLRYPKAKIITLDLLPANYPELKSEAQDTILDTIANDEDWYLHKLEWLCFWTDYALKNCKKPIFKNS